MKKLLVIGLSVLTMLSTLLISCQRPSIKTATTLVLERADAIARVQIAEVLNDKDIADHHDTIFMIHGMGRTASLWDNYVGFFESQGYDAKAITLLYHGNSKDKLKDIGIMDYVEQAKTEIEKLSDKPIIIGYSMGGLIAQKLAEMGLASKLVLIAPSAPKGISVMAPSVLITFSANICDVVLKKPFLIPFRNAAYGLMNTMSHDEQVESYQCFVYESGLAAYEIMRGEIHVDESKVTCPVLVVAGRQDRATPPKVVRKVADKYNALYVEYPGHCHGSLVKGLGWEKIAEDISRWIEK